MSTLRVAAGAIAGRLSALLRTRQVFGDEAWLTARENSATDLERGLARRRTD
jgi:hypothetical protein